MPYKFLEGITVADVAFEAVGKTLEELLESAALATTEVMVRNLPSIKPEVRKSVKLEADSEEKLLFNFLQEIIFYKDAEMLVFGKYEIKTAKKGEKLSLKANLYGEKIDAKRHEMIVDVKAVTWHRFELKRLETGWKAVVVLDI